MTLLPRGAAVAVAVILGGGGLLYGWSEYQRSVLRNRELAARVAALDGDLARSDRRASELAGAVERLERELHTALDQQRHVHESLERYRSEAEERTAAERARRAEALRPMPEGVRLALVAIHDCLRLDGHNGVRLVRAGGLVDRELRDVELVDHDPATLRTAAYRAARATLTLDRAAARLTLRMFDGVCHTAGERVEFGGDGLAIEFADVWGPDWERRLPYLVEPIGEYPPVERTPRLPRIDPIQRASWHERLARLLEGSGTEVSYVVSRFRDLVDGEFRDAVLLGSDRGKTLAMSAEVEALAIEVDRAARTVALRLRTGILRRAAGETTIPEHGYRILLPDLQPEHAIDLMLGMVVYAR